METTLPLWIIPLLITIVSFGYALFIHDDGGGYFSGMGNLMRFSQEPDLLGWWEKEQLKRDVT